MQHGVDVTKFVPYIRNFLLISRQGEFTLEIHFFQISEDTVVIELCAEKPMDEIGSSSLNILYVLIINIYIYQLEIANSQCLALPHNRQLHGEQN